ncbi:MAG: hypothetical protein WDW38_009224 [Sanguina aurantia]
MHAVTDYHTVASSWRESGQKRKPSGTSGNIKPRRNSDGYSTAGVLLFSACLLVSFSALFTIAALHHVYSAGSPVPVGYTQVPSASALASASPSQATPKPAKYTRTTVTASTSLPTTTTTTTTTTITVTKSDPASRTHTPAPTPPSPSQLETRSKQLPVIVSIATPTAKPQTVGASEARNGSLRSVKPAAAAAAPPAKIPLVALEANAPLLSPIVASAMNYGDLTSDLLPFLEAAAAAAITASPSAAQPTTDAMELLQQQQQEQQLHTLPDVALSPPSLTAMLDIVERLLELSGLDTAPKNSTRGGIAMPSPSDARTLAAMPATARALQQLLHVARGCAATFDGSAGASTDARELAQTRSLLSWSFAQLGKEVRASSAQLSERSGFRPVFMTVRRATTATIVLCLTAHPTLLGNPDALLNASSAQRGRQRAIAEESAAAAALDAAASAASPPDTVTTILTTNLTTISTTVRPSVTPAAGGAARALLVGGEAAAAAAAATGGDVGGGPVVAEGGGDESVVWRRRGGGVKVVAGSDEGGVRSLRAGMWGLLALLQQSHEASRASRGIIEYMHVSKAGGSSMCAVAKENKCRNPNLNPGMNCLMPEIAADMPRWTRLDLVPKGLLHDALRNSGFITDCRASAPAALSCTARHQLFTSRSYDFAANENAVHGGTPGTAYAAHPQASNGLCEQFVNVLTLREPARHLLSMLGEVILWHAKILREAPKYSRTRAYIRAPMELPRGLEFWKALAPAVLDNYYTRMLVGRRGSCLALGALRRPTWTWRCRTC